MNQVKGTCTFQTVDLQDIVDAVPTMSASSAEGFIALPPGTGVFEQINWALKEVSDAAAATNQSDISRLSTNAVLSARRALSCLVDLFLDSRGFTCCKDLSPKANDKKIEILERMRIVDPLSAKVLGRAVGIRNFAEHRYVPPSVDVAEDKVELFRRILESVERESSPSHVACFYGFLAHGHSLTEKNGTNVWFGGWVGTEPRLVVASFLEDPWVGIIDPTTSNSAHVRRAWLKTIKADEYVTLLDLIERQFPRANSFASESRWQVLAKEIGLA